MSTHDAPLRAVARRPTTPHVSVSLPFPPPDSACASLPAQAVFLSQTSPELEVPREALAGGTAAVDLLLGLTTCSAFAFATLHGGQLGVIALDAFLPQAAVVELSPVAPRGKGPPRVTVPMAHLGLQGATFVAT